MKKRICVLGSGGLNGGLQVHFDELVKFLRNEGHEVFSICIRDSDQNPDGKVQHSASVVGKNGKLTGQFLKTLSWYSAIAKAKKFHPDLLISTACGRGYAAMGRALGERPYKIFQVVTDDYQPKSKLLKEMIAGYDAVAVQSQKLSEPIISKMQYDGPLKPLPCFHQIYVSTQLANNWQNSGNIQLAYFGRLAANKGLAVLLAALSELGRKDVSLDIWGRGPEESALRSAIGESAFLSETVAIKGVYPGGDEYSKLLASYHGLVAPSQRTEGLPLVLLESASVGLPFLSCNVGAIADCLIENDDALVVETGRTALNAGLIRFIDRIQRKVFNNQRLKSWFSCHQSRSVHEDTWREMLKSPEVYFNQ
ncbi:glycosyltransferase family 4 protein [Rhodopirellula halodulae]|uniref:glycosyltransferase family 4 protein n=1 Tax=Rhodopirellula halodulae TaxID=2894198 RepID=UPI001E3A44E4|nr:glycosyltransferase family 4 protein [Rhodopirellula sp. JC737]MCC9656096.1 glycosyltransferase family 4 protein [Rhodopirellula sp. JC737]